MSIKSKVFTATTTLTLVAGAGCHGRYLRQRGHPVVWR